MFWTVFTVIACVFLFIGTFILNKKTKVDFDVDESVLPENCLNCQNQTCKNDLKQKYDKEHKNLIIDECNKGE